ncbi:hypothetical protein SDC9_147777 [bioreactor metagenome]|uniref:Uncharacterized protein n=1 Tax=bioreactor metagenome TaxID=1076179 RepID=A0A645EFA7_9ZZZZ
MFGEVIGGHKHEGHLHKFRGLEREAGDGDPVFCAALLFPYDKQHTQNGQTAHNHHPVELLKEGWLMHEPHTNKHGYHAQPVEQ